MKTRSKQMTYKEAKILGLLRKVEVSPCDVDYRGSAIYVLKFENGCKIGVAKNLANRLKCYDTPWTRSITAIQAFKSCNVHILELSIKRRFKKYTREGSSEFLYGDTFNMIVSYIHQNPGFKKL